MILLPIHPKFVERIKDRSKRFEFRKRLPRKPLEGDYVAIYSTSPVCKIVGCFRVGSVLSGSPSEIWAQTFCHAGIDRRDFNAYFANSALAYALSIQKTVWLSEPISLYRLRHSKTPPQSFFYLTEEQRKLLASLLDMCSGGAWR